MMGEPIEITTYVTVPIVLKYFGYQDGVNEVYEVEGYDRWDDGLPGDYGDTYVIDDSHPDGGYWESDYRAQALAADWIAERLLREVSDA